MARIRPSKYRAAMNMAKQAAELSHDEETQVGAVLIKNKTGAIIASAYNGFVRHAPDDKLPTTRPDKYPYMMHSEKNLVSNCARHGISMDDCTVVCTHSPCIDCMRFLWQCGITRVICEIKYRDFEALQKMMDLSVKSTDLDDGLTLLEYEVKK
jgi:dCMP deaminase